MPLSSGSKKGFVAVGEKRRIVGYDAAKALAMYLVVLIHSIYYAGGYPGTPLGITVSSSTSICVPLFFAVNGALVLNRSMDFGRHYRRCLQIFITLVVWKLLALCFFWGVARYPVEGPWQVLIYLLGGNLENSPTGYFWFMNALLAVYLILPLVKFAIDNADQRISRALFIVILVFASLGDSLATVVSMILQVPTPAVKEVIDVVGEMNIFGAYGYVILYFYIGWYLGATLSRAKDDGRLSSWKGFRWLVGLSNGVKVLLLLVCYAITVLVHFYQIGYKGGVGFGTDYSYWFLTTLVATFLVLDLCVRHHFSGASERFFKLVGANTFSVYMLHFFVITM